jgi:hypothetical protein
MVSSSSLEELGRKVTCYDGSVFKQKRHGVVCPQIVERFVISFLAHGLTPFHFGAMARLAPHEFLSSTSES